MIIAGFAYAKEFHECREAAIAAMFNLDEVSQRILNADGLALPVYNDAGELQRYTLMTITRFIFLLTSLVN